MEQGENQAADKLPVSSSDNNESEGNCAEFVAACSCKAHVIGDAYIRFDTKTKGRKNSTASNHHDTQYLFIEYTSGYKP